MTAHQATEGSLNPKALLSMKMQVRPQTSEGPSATVTVVIPCFNYAAYLPAAVNSALSQTGVQVDVVIVDDKSADDSLAVARAMAMDDPRIQVIAHAANTGPVQSFNDGLAVARGEFLVRLDADDLLTPGSLARSVALARCYPSVGLVYGHPLHFTGDDLPIPRTHPTRWTIWPGRQWLSDRCRSGFNVITSPEALMRMSVVSEVGGQKPLAHTHDMEMWLRLSAVSDVGYIHGADQAWHREHAGSLSARGVDPYRDLVERRQAFETLFDGVAGRIPEADRLRHVARTAIAAHALEAASRVYDRGQLDRDAVERFVAVASSVVPDVRNVRGWQGLETRMALGPSRSAWHPGIFLERAIRSLRNSISWHRWHRDGVF